MKYNEENILDKLAKNIKTKRLELGMSQEVLAEECHLDRTYISLLERSKRNPSVKNLKKLSIGLEISLSDLLKDI